MGGVYMAAGSCASRDRKRLEAGRTRSRGAEKAETRGASERRNRERLQTKLTSGPGVSAEGRRHGGFDRSVRTKRTRRRRGSDRPIAELGRGARDGPGASERRRRGPGKELTAAQRERKKKGGLG